jgi:hypothetical protein
MERRNKSQKSFKTIFPIQILMLLCGFSLFAEDVRILSPDGNYQMRIYDRAGRIYYSVEYTIVRYKNKYAQAAIFPHWINS